MTERTPEQLAETHSWECDCDFELVEDGAVQRVHFFHGPDCQLARLQAAERERDEARAWVGDGLDYVAALAKLQVELGKRGARVAELEARLWKQPCEWGCGPDDGEQYVGGPGVGVCPACNVHGDLNPAFALPALAASRGTPEAKETE